MTKQIISAEYLGGAFLPGVPARDLDKAECKIYKNQIENSNLYNLIYSEVKHGRNKGTK